MNDFNWPVLIWPLALIAFVVFYFRRYYKDITSPGRTIKKKKRKKYKPPPPPVLSLEGRPGRMTKRDWLLALALTVVYGVLAFSFAGSARVPQTFWRATEAQPTLTLDLGEEVRLDNLLYYVGINPEQYGNWTLELSSDGQSWRTQPTMWHDSWDVFKWRIPLLEEGIRPTRFIRVTADHEGMELGELALVTIDEKGSRTLFDMTSLATLSDARYAALFDEQSLVPDLPDLDNNQIFALIQNTDRVQKNSGTISDHRNGPIFDEVFYAKAAFEYTRNTIAPTEITHPPLGKIIIALGIEIFGISPFGWRFMGILFGVLMLPMLYVFIRNLFDNTTIAVCGTALFAFENMHFTQTHVATIDTYVVFFIMAMYLFMYRYISSGYDAPFSKTLPPLFLCGLSFGLGIATKWTGFYAALGLIVLYVTYLVKRGRHQCSIGKQIEYRAFLWRTLSVSVGFFVVFPFTIYTLSYIPFLAGQQLSLSGLLGEMWGNQGYMLDFHSRHIVETENFHKYQSQWWEWMLGIRPICYYDNNFLDGSRTIIAAFTNPLVTIGGLVAMAFALRDLYRKREKQAFIIVIGYLAQLLPWILVARITFAYHYYPSMLFLVLAVCHVFKNILDAAPEYKKRLYLFTGVSVALFFLLFPPTAGITMPAWYADWVARWLPSWPF